MNEKRDLSHLIDRIVSSDLFRQANYYFRSMKKQPHGGVAHINVPNVYLRHYTADATPLFIHDPEKIPFFLETLVDEAYQEYLKCEIDLEELCWLCFDDDLFWYVGYRVLKPKVEYEEENRGAAIICTVISSKLRFQDYFVFNHKVLVYVLVCYLIKSKMIHINGIPEILRHEDLRTPHNKYGLSIVNGAKFLRQGFILDEKYYLYNIFFDTTIGDAFDEYPYTIKVIMEEIPAGSLFLRCDEKVAVPAIKIISTATIDFQKYRGITVDFGDIEKIVYKKEIIVHYNPDHLNKVLMIIKPDSDASGHSFYHIEVEELWNPSKANDPFVITNYIHSQFYPDKKCFNHIDFSVNQYGKAVFEEKYKDAVTDTTVPIDKYGEKHYKIWCIESDEIAISTWSKLVYATLDELFRDLFIEMFSVTIN